MIHWTSEPSECKLLRFHGAEGTQVNIIYHSNVIWIEGGDNIFLNSKKEVDIFIAALIRAKEELER